MSIHAKQWIHVMSLSALFVGGIFCIHYILPSIINIHTHYIFQLVDYTHRIDHYFAEEMLSYHVSHPAFVRRVWVSGGMELIHRVLDLSYAYSFMLINFSALFVCGLLLYKISRTFDYTHTESLWSIILFYTSFTILFAFTMEMSTYDDIVQYILVWLTLLYIYKQKWYFAITTFVLALWSRETTLLIIPGFILFFYPYKEKFKHAVHTNAFKKLIFIIGISSILYVGVLYVALQYFGMSDHTKAYFLNERFSHWLFNFRDPQEALLSIVSVIYALGVPFSLLMAYMKRQTLSAHMRRVIYAFLVVLIINTIIVFTTARTREARLLALPLIFIWPFLGHVAISVYNDIKKCVSTFTKDSISIVLNSCLGIFLIGVSYVFCFIIFKPRIAIELLFWFRLYIFLFLFFIIMYTIINRLSKDNI